MNEYPDDWKRGILQRAAYERARWKCEHCHMEFIPGSTRARWATNRDGKPMILTVHHIDGDKSNCDWTNLLSCCQRCHLSIQGTWKPGGMLPWPEPPQWLIERGLPYVRPWVQLALFAESGM